MDYILKIKQLIKIKKISQRELAKMVNKTQTTVNNWLIGKTKLDVDAMLDIARALDVHPCVFFKDMNDSQITAIGRGNAVLNGNGSAIIYGEPSETKKAQFERLQVLFSETEKLRTENELLRQQIADKDKIISLLEKR